MTSLNQEAPASTTEDQDTEAITSAFLDGLVVYAGRIQDTGAEMGLDPKAVFRDLVVPLLAVSGMATFQASLGRAVKEVLSARKGAGGTKSEEFQRLEILLKITEDAFKELSRLLIVPAMETEPYKTLMERAKKCAG